MATPTIAPASIVTINNGTNTTGTASPTLKASGNDRILVAIAVPKDNSSTVAAPSALVIDSAGVNSSIANGKIVHKGTLQLAQEGQYSSTCDVFFCLDANLPSSAGAYVVDTTLDSAPQYHMWIIFEVADCPKQAYDKLVQNLSVSNISGGGTLTETITPVDDDCLIVFVASLSHSATSAYTSTETQIAAITSNNNGGAVLSKFAQVGAATAKTMTHTTPSLSQRQAWTAISFSGVASGITGSGTLVAGNASISGSGIRTVVGSGAIQSGNATISGAGIRTVIGSGVLQSGTASISGLGVRKIVGLGSLQSDIASLSGSGSVGGTVTGSGNLISGNATLLGVGVRKVIASGALQSGNATLAGLGIRVVTGIGSLQSGNASISGAGSVGGTVTGSGNLISGNATLSGVGVRKVTASGNLQSGNASISGIGFRLVVGSGALVSGPATIIGNDNILSPRYEIINATLYLNQAVDASLNIESVIDAQLYDTPTAAN